jgi:hypothetical protein
MPVDIFQFWSQVGLTDKCHPEDRKVLSRMRKTHLFDLRCLPHCFVGPLRTAPVVLLYLSPGFSENDDLKDARTRRGRARYMECRNGKQPLSGPEEHLAGWKWWKSRTSIFDDWKTLQNKVAVLNIGAYHSKSFGDRPLLAALPSSRVSIDWAQRVLFPQAIAGERVVICLRASQFWGLFEGNNGKRYGKSLYAPRVTRSGHMRIGAMREEIRRKVRSAISSAYS